MQKVEVVDIKKVEGGSSLKGFATVQLGDIVIHDFKIVQQNGQEAWVSPPQITWKNDAGETKYKPIVELSKETKQAVEQAVLLKWKGKK